MKEVMAVIRINMINETKRALIDAGISSFTAPGKVLGRGRCQVDFQFLTGELQEVAHPSSHLTTEAPLIAKRLVTVVVPNHLVKTVVDTIITTNQTGRPGDGKIFVLPVLDSVRIRNGECGDMILDQ